MNGVLITIGSDLGFVLTDWDKEVLTSITSIGALVSALVSGFIADRYGRKSVMWISTFVFTVGALLQAFSSRFILVVSGRFIVGLGVGAAAMVVPMYIAECAPAKYRGRLIVIDVLCITGGQVLSYLIGAAFKNVPNGWRYMVGLGALPSSLLFIILPLLPESPRYLIQQVKPKEARIVIQKTFPNASQDQVDEKMSLLSDSVKDVPKHIPLSEQFTLLFRKRENFNPLMVAAGLMAIQQLCGFNTLMYYSSTLFQMVGFSDPIAVGITIPVANFIFTCVSLNCIDSFGRRRILVWSMWGMPLGLILAAIGFQFIPKDAAGAFIIGGAVGWGAIMVLISIIVFVAAYATGLGNVPWQSTEFFPMQVRGLATTIVTCFNWGPNIIISATFLTLMKTLTPSGTFILYAGICLIGWLAVLKWYPECAGLTLEEIHLVFSGEGSAVKNANDVQRQKMLHSDANKL